MLNLVVVEGEGAINNIRQRTAREPIVQVEDENHKPVAGAIVTFTLPGHGPGGLFPNGAQSLTVTTDAQGRAVARGLRPNNLQGRFEIRVNANYRGQTATAVIAQINELVAGAAASAGGGISGKLIAIIAVVGAAAAGGAAYAIHSSGGGGTGGSGAVVTPGTTVSAGTGQVGPPR